MRHGVVPVAAADPYLATATGSAHARSWRGGYCRGIQDDTEHLRITGMPHIKTVAIVITAGHS
jgi:hypothetical protein